MSHLSRKGGLVPKASTTTLWSREQSTESCFKFPVYHRSCASIGKPFLVYNLSYNRLGVNIQGDFVKPLAPELLQNRLRYRWHLSLIPKALSLKRGNAVQRSDGLSLCSSGTCIKTGRIRVRPGPAEEMVFMTTCSSL